MGTVYLVGAGPGDPELLTVRGARLLGRADVVLHDALSNDELLEHAPPDALRIDVGRRARRRRGPSQEEINRLLIELAGKNEVVVRLKGGDPCVFGRGGEEAIALYEAGVPFEIVPGITAGLGALAYAGIPLTHRGVTSSATFVTGHDAGGGRIGGVDWDHVARVGGTLVVYMGLSKVEGVTARLLSGGRSPDTPAAVIEAGTYTHQRVITGTLANIAERTRAAAVGSPALIVVGEVVALSSAMAWFRGVAEDAAGHGRPARRDRARTDSGGGAAPEPVPPPRAAPGPALAPRRRTASTNGHRPYPATWSVRSRSA